MRRIICGSGLDRDTGNAVLQVGRGHAIASKPAPEKKPLRPATVRIRSNGLISLQLQLEHGLQYPRSSESSINGIWWSDSFTPKHRLHGA
ncbi:hypothetical protein EU514_06535 [Pseudomonas fragi]|nr:hypothetical protein [Pseudomonas fragi]